MLIEAPPMAAGSDGQKLSAVYSYLYQLSEQLNTALNNLTVANFAPQEAQALQSVAAGTVQKAQADQASALKSLIIKTADVVRAEMDELETTLRSEYVAESEFGSFQESLEAQIKATAQGVVQSYGYESKIDDVAGGMVDFESYRQELQAYIKTGLLYYGDDGLPVYGVAVGENIAKVTVDGKEVLERKGLMSTFTANRLSFWQGETETAYMTAGVLHIAKAELSDQLVVGHYVIKRMSDGGFAIMRNI